MRVKREWERSDIIPSHPTHTPPQASRPAAEAATAAKGSYGVGCGEEWMVWMAVIWALRVVSIGEGGRGGGGGSRCFHG